MRGAGDRHGEATCAKAALAMLAALTVAAVLPGLALAAPTWLAPSDLSAPGYNGEEPQVAVDQAGDVVAVWVRFDGSNEIVQAASRPAGGSWGAPVDLSAPGEDAEDPRITVDAAGDAVAVWRRYDGSDEIVQAASRSAAGSWGAPVDLSVGGESADSPAVAVDPAGDAVAVWRRYDGFDEIIQASTRRAGGIWQSPVALSEASENAFRPQVAVDGVGNPVAVWDRSDGVHTIIQAASRPAGGAWEAPVDLSAAGGSAVKPRIAVDPAGDAVVVWGRDNGTNEVVQAAERAAGGTWQAPVDLSELSAEASIPDVALDPAGDAVAVWEVFDGSNYLIQAATAAAGGGWRAPVDLSAPGSDAEEPSVALDPAGDAVAVWDRYDGSDDIAQAATMTPGGAWQPAVDLSAAGESAKEAQVAFDPAGDAVATWWRSDGSNAIVQAAGYDAAGPRLRSLSIPAAGTVGVPLSFSVSPLDVWSAPGATTWSFGDGGSAAGTAVAHTYTTPGTYTVEVTGTDAVGNASTATGTVAIKAGAAGASTSTGRKGKARAGRVVKVKGGVALLALSCGAGAGCAGTARLSVAKSKRGAAASAGHRQRQIRIGKATFDFAARRHRTIRVPLTKKGGALVAAAGHRGLGARLAGSGVIGRAVVLKVLGHQHRRR